MALSPVERGTLEPNLEAQQSLASTDLAIQGPVIAVTRVRFRSCIWTVVAWLRFGRLYRKLTPASGFIGGHISVVDPLTLLNVSIWRERRAMLLWSGRTEHVRAVQWTYGKTTEVWSADWHRPRLSPSAQVWNGRALLEPAEAADPA